MDNIDFFADILQCIYDIYLWVFDKQGNLIRTNSPLETVLGDDYYDVHRELIRSSAWKHTKPTIINSGFETMWVIDSSRVNNELEKICALGPFYIDSFSEKNIRLKIEETSLSLNSRHRIFEVLKSLPVVPFTRVAEYAVMFHYVLTGERIYTYDLHVDHFETTDIGTGYDEETRVHGTYEYEQQILRMIREGDTGLTDFLRKNSNTTIIGKLANDDSDSLRQLKNTILVAITLYSRAAIEGGLYPDTALTLTDRYFQAVEAAKTFQDIININLVMQQDFVNRVHKIRMDNSCSKTVKMVKEYIDLHKEDEILLKDMAREFGYAEYYLSKKFHSEVGVTIKEYIRDTRLEYARYLLKHEKEPVREISERLHFTSQSFFTDCFRKKYGMTPNEYRQSD